MYYHSFIRDFVPLRIRTVNILNLNLLFIAPKEDMLFNRPNYYFRETDGTPTTNTRGTS